MPRYIDAQLLPKLFDEEYKKTRKLIQEGETHLDNIAEGFSEAARVVRFVAPTADVVEVVRCKDCKYLERTDCFGECSLFRDRDEPRGEMLPNDFCSYGKRKGASE